MPPKVTVFGIEFIGFKPGGAVPNTGETELILEVGSNVQIVIIVSADRNTSGDLTIKLMRDIKGDDDTLEIMCSVPATQVLTTFTRVTGCVRNISTPTTGSIRQYYVRVYWDGELIYNPVDPDNRANITTIPAPTPTPTSG